MVLPTGAGKSLTMSLMMRDALSWGKRCLLVTHRKELLQQIGATLSRIGCHDVGFYSAGLDRRDTSNAIILAGIQSVYNRAELFGPRDFIFVDEAHRIDPICEKTMYGQLFSSMPNARIIGFTATPYRLGTGYIVGEDSWLTAISYQISVAELIGKGYLSLLTSKWLNGIDTSKLSISKGEFAENEQQAAFLACIEQTNADIYQRTQDRNSVIIFCSGVEAVEKTREFYLRQGIICGAITGDTPTDTREEYIQAFRAGHIKYLANCNVLTEGFDAPNVDAVVLARATLSPGLYYQMAGRGLRKHPGKESCLVLDYGENIARHGAIDDITPAYKKSSGKPGMAPVKQCPHCFDAVAISALHCPTCDHEFVKEDKAKLTAKPSSRSILSSGEPKDEAPWLPIRSVAFRTQQTSSGKNAIRVAYYSDDRPIGQPVASELVNIESPKAKFFTDRWWLKFAFGTAPDSAEKAVSFLNSIYAAGKYKTPTAVQVLPQKNNPQYTQLKFSFAKKHLKKAGEPTNG